MYRRLRLLILVCILMLPVGTHAQESDPMFESVESFYEWYLAYEGNPLSNRAYQESPYLSEALIAEVDKMAEKVVFTSTPCCVRRIFPSVLK